MTQFTRKALSGAAIFGSTLLLAACNSSGDSASLAAGPDAAAGSNGKSQVIAGPLDPLQEQVVSGILGDQIGGTLPEPLGPISTTTSPRATSRSTSASATTSPYRLETPSSRITAGPVPSDRSCRGGARAAARRARAAR